MERELGRLRGRRAPDETSTAAKLRRGRLRGHRHRAHARLSRGRRAGVPRPGRDRRRRHRADGGRQVHECIRPGAQASRGVSRPLERPDPGPPPRRRGGRHGVPARGRGRLRDHGRAPRRRERGHRPARQHHRHRRRARRAHPDVRADLRRALQSGRHAGRRLAGRLAVARRAGLRGRADRRGLRRRGRGEHHVRASHCTGFESRAGLVVRNCSASSSRRSACSP